MTWRDGPAPDQEDGTVSGPVLCRVCLLEPSLTPDSPAGHGLGEQCLARARYRFLDGEPPMEALDPTRTPDDGQ